MRQWTLRLGLSLMVVVGFWTSQSPAQEPIPQPKKAPVQVLPPPALQPLPVYGPHVFVVPVTPYEPAHHPELPPAFAPRLPAPLANGHITRTLNNCGIGCGMDPFYSACSNLHYELYFAFGSCRWFFNESCPPYGLRHGNGYGHGHGHGHKHMIP